MPIDLATERLLSFADAARMLPPRRAGRKVAAHTIAGYCLRGLRGVQLEYEQVGGRKVTSVEALHRFSDALKGMRPVPVPLRSSARREREIRRAYELARKQGFKV